MIIKSEICVLLAKQEDEYKKLTIIYIYIFFSTSDFE